MADGHTDRARRVWVRALWEAQVSGASELDNRHRVLAVLVEVDSEPPEPEDPPIVREQECLAAIYLRLTGADRAVYEQTLRDGHPRPGPPDRRPPMLPLSRGLKRATYNEAHYGRGRHGVVIDTASAAVDLGRGQQRRPPCRQGRRTRGSLGTDERRARAEGPARDARAAGPPDLHPRGADGDAAVKRTVHPPSNAVTGLASTV